MKIKLPAFDNNRKWRVAAAGYAVFCLLYTLAGATPFRRPVVLSPTAIDKSMPFVGWSVWVYMSQFFFLVFSVMILKQPRSISRALYSMTLASALSFAVFFTYPTMLARGPATAGGLTGRMFEFLYRIDSSANCFPSLHVSLAWLAALGVAGEDRGKGIAAIVFASVISLSTMTTGQHYLIDVAAGLVVAAICRAVVAKIEFTRHGSSAGS